MNHTIDSEIRKNVENVLSHISEQGEQEGSYVWMTEKGYFRQGILLGKAAGKQEAEYVGSLTRAQKKERLLRQLAGEIEQARTVLQILVQEKEQLENRMATLKRPTGGKHLLVAPIGSLTAQIQLLFYCAVIIFRKFSGGEKAMAMYVPLFAAVNAQYQKAENRDHPRIIALDEAFAGVDDKNISSMFKLVEDMDFDYIMNSQALWGCFETVPALRISELLRPLNSQVITVIHYTWNGHERILDEQ